MEVGVLGDKSSRDGDESDIGSLRTLVWSGAIDVASESVVDRAPLTVLCDLAAGLSDEAFLGVAWRRAVLGFEASESCESSSNSMFWRKLDFDAVVFGPAPF